MIIKNFITVKVLLLYKHSNQTTQQVEFLAHIRQNIYVIIGYSL